MLLLAIGACPDEPVEPCVPIVDSIAIVPREVTVPENATFELRARLYTKAVSGYRSAIPETYGYRPAWESSDGELLFVRTRVDHTVVLQSGILDGAEERSIEVVAEAVPGVFSTATVHVVKPAASGDRIVRRGDVSAAPAVGVVTGTGDGGPSLWFALRPFVRGVGLTPLMGGGEAVLFANEREAGFRPHPPAAGPWTSSATTPAGDLVDFSLLGNPVSMTLTVWVPDYVVNEDWDAITIEGIARVFLADAVRILSVNRTGIDITYSIKHYSSFFPIAAVCYGEVPGQVPGTLNVYFSPSMENEETGVQCPALGPFEPYIIVSIANTWPSTLAHELGHALSLSDLSFDTPGFEHSPDNLMKPVNSNRVDARTHLTLGQVYFMNRDHLSWLFYDPAGPIRSRDLMLGCWFSMYDASLSSSVCPALSLDLP